ncbi:unnamed protein product, partial [marine sediment metagenome]
MTNGVELGIQRVFRALSTISGELDTSWAKKGFEVIKSFVSSPNVVIREHAISALAKVKTADAVGILADLLVDSRLGSVVQSALAKLGSLCIDAVGNVLQSAESTELCRRCINILETIGTLRAVETLAAVFYHKSEEVRLESCLAVGRLLKIKGTARLVRSIDV